MVWNNRFLIAGQSGTGKSWYTSYLIRRYCSQNKRRYIVILDTTTDHMQYLADCGFQTLYIDRIRARKGVDWVSFIRFHPRLLVVIGDLVGEEIQQCVDRIGRAIIRLGNTLLVIDEAHSIYHVDYPSAEIERICRGGRKLGIDIILSTQRLQGIPLGGRSQANVIIAFHLDDVRDRDLITPRLGSYKGQSADSIVSSLPPMKALVRDTESGKVELISTRGLRM